LLFNGGGAADLALLCACKCDDLAANLHLWQSEAVVVAWSVATERAALLLIVLKEGEAALQNALHRHVILVVILPFTVLCAVAIAV
jgi:hypothetical protein